jgi:hypothetical protein
MSVTTPIIAVMIAQRNKVILTLRDAGAVSAETALLAFPVRGFGNSQFEQLVRLGIVVELSNGATFLNEARFAEWQTHEQKRGRRLLVATIAVAGLVALVSYLSN